MRIATEQVSKYHPDKYADQISDKIVTYLLNINPAAKVAVETLVKDNIVVLAGEISGVELSQSLASELVRTVAAEYTKRKSLNLELDPNYVNAIITRFERMTGKKHVKIREGT